MAGEVWDELVVRISADRFVGGPAAAAVVANALEQRAAQLRRNGLPEGLAEAEIRRTLRAVASTAGHVIHAGGGHADVRDSPASAGSDSWIDMATAASLMGGLTDRHCRRLALDGAFGPSRKVKGRRLVRLSAVKAAVQLRKQRQAS
jgi:hypothetical protein